MTRHDIVIVGSGIAGLSSAYRLADRGNVVVVDEDAVGQGTSSRASGVITSPLEYHDLPRWTERSVESYRELDGVGVFAFDERPFIRPVNTDAEAERTRDRDDATLLDPMEAMERYGHVLSSPGEKGVALYGDVGLCDVTALLATLKRECEKRGVEFRPDTRVTGMREDEGRVTGVDTEYGTIDADRVVVAAGSATPGLLPDRIELPIRPFTWNAVYLDVDVDVSDWPTGGDRERQIYWRPTPSGLLLVGRENRTFSAEPEIDPEFERLVAEDLPEYLEYDDYEIVRWEKCPMADATTPDARAIIDAPADAPNGLVVAAGFHGAGVMSGLAIGDAVRSLVTGEEAPVELEAFALDRFDDSDPEFEFVSLWH